MPLRRRCLGAILSVFLGLGAFAPAQSGESGGSAPRETAPRGPDVYVSTDARQRQIAAEDEAIREALNHPLAEFAVSDTPFEQALSLLLERSRVRNWHVRWEPLESGGVARNRKVSIRLRDVAAWRALDLLLGEVASEETRPTYEPVEGVLVVSTDEDLWRHRRMETRVYPIGDLLVGDLVRMRQRLAALREKKPHASDVVSLSAAAEAHYRAAIERMKAMDPNTETTDGDAQDQEEERSVSRMMMATIIVIQQSLEPDSWCANGGTGTVQAYADSIVVRNSVTVHCMVARLLNDLRAADIANADRKGAALRDGSSAQASSR